MDKTKVSLLDCENFFSSEFSDKFLALLPENENDGDPLHRCGRLLFRYMLVESGEMTADEAKKVELKTNEHGKPYIEGSNIKFNISHSGRLVGCALTTVGDVGFDLQIRDKSVDKCDKLAKRFFSQSEQEVLKHAPDREKMFHLLWARKESLVKYHGISFENSEKTDSAELPSELCIFAGFMSQEKESYAFSLCCERGVAVEQPRFVMPGELLSVLGK